jgi:hypothetical protein
MHLGAGLVINGFSSLKKYFLQRTPESIGMIISNIQRVSRVL